MFVAKSLLTVGSWDTGITHYYSEQLLNIFCSPIAEGSQAPFSFAQAHSDPSRIFPKWIR